MLKNQVAWLLPISVLLAPAYLGAQIDSSLFEWKKRDSAEQKMTFSFGDQEGGVRGVEILDESLSLEVIELRIKSFSEILENEKDAVKSIDILISRATLYLQKASILRKKKSVGEMISPEEKAAFDASAGDLKKVLLVQQIDPVKKSYANYLLALINVDLGKTQEAFKHFESALKLDAKSKYAPGIVFFMSEHHFRGGEPQKSFHLLERHLPLMKGDGFAMALYKMAWSLVATGQKYLAEKYFIRLLKEASKSHAAKAAIRELALVASEVRTEQELVEMADKLFDKLPAQKLEFLSTAYSNYRRENPEFQAQIIFNRLIRFANTPEKRMELWLNEMRASDRPYASIAQMSAFNSLERELRKVDSKKRKEILKVYLAEIELEATRLIGSYLRTFAGEVKNEEGLSKKQMGENLLRQLKFYTNYFGDSSKIGPVFNLWMDIASNIESHSDLLKVSQRVIADSRFSQLHEKAELNRIRALDKLANGKNLKLKKELKESLTQYLVDRDRPRWREFADYLATVLFEMGEIDASVDWLRVVYIRYNDKASYDRLIQGYFEAQKYEMVLSLGRDSKFNDQKTNKIIREANLQLAIKAKSNDLDSYQKYVKSYLSFSSDREKRLIVLTDYYSTLVNQKKWVQLYREIAEQKEDWIHFEPQLDQLVSYLFLRRKWKPLDKLLTSLPRIERSQGLLVRKIAASYGLYGRIDVGSFKRLKDEAQAYLLQNLAISDPKMALEVLEKNPKGQKSVRSLGVLALQAKCQNFLPRASCPLKTTLERQIAKRLIRDEKTEAEKVLEKTNFRIAARSLDESVLKAANQVRLARSRVGESIKNADFHVKQRTLEALKQAELKMAKILAELKTPETLSARQRQQFATELEQLAMEFRGQASTFAKALEDLTDGYLGRTDSRAPASVSAFQWPKDLPWVTELEGMSRDGQNRFMSLLYIDEMKVAGLEKHQYHLLRALVMREALPNPVVKRFFIEEFRGAKLKDLEEQWMKL